MPQWKSRSHPPPHDALQADCDENQWTKSHVHCSGQIARCVLSIVRFDGVDSTACVAGEEFGAAGEVVVDSVPRLHPRRPANSVAAKTKDLITYSCRW